MNTNGVLKAAWLLTAFVIVAGIVGWIVTGRVVFTVFLALGLVTAVGAWLTGRSTPAPPPSSSPSSSPSSKEDLP